MDSLQKKKKGGFRVGAGRPKGTKKEPTCQIRIPNDIANWLRVPQNLEQVREMIKTKDSSPALELPENALIEFCKKHYILRMGLYGSALTNSFNDKSDIDLLVDFDSKHIPGLIKVAGMELELEKLLGRKVDLRTPQDLSPYFRQEVINNTKMIYGQKRYKQS